MESGYRVSNPDLSQQRTDILPSVSSEFDCRTLNPVPRTRTAEAIWMRYPDSINPEGATASTTRTARESAVNTEAESAANAATITKTTSSKATTKSPISSGEVSLCRNVGLSLATGSAAEDRKSTVRSPVATTTPLPDPSQQWLP